ncbi:MAG TPA: M23 family metallopeptidase [Nevskiaceae bacterium]|nr:M23 family metallopeptidase [Nevskiaceae bacterium]
MDIIVVSQSGGRTVRLTRNPRLYLWIAGPLLALLVIAVSSGYFLGRFGWRGGAAGHDRDTHAALKLLQGMQLKLDAEQSQVALAQTTADDNANALARKLAHLQADVMRLDAAGQRMVQVAHIDSGEFNFNQPVPVGGPELPVSAQPELVTPGMRAIAHLQAQLTERQREFTVLEDILRTTKLRKETEPTGWPIKTGYITSGFGYRTDPFTGLKSFHPGIDLAGPRGEAVHAVAAGIVVHAGPDAGYGKMVEINHGNGVETVYGHNEKILVHVGQKVLRGQPIALEGSTGRSTGPHCHFEVRIDGKPVNPLRFLEAAR